MTIGVSVYLYIEIPKGFFPQQDTGRLQGNIMGQQHISYQSLVEKVKWFEEQVRNDPAVDVVNVTAGSNAGGRGGANNANMNIQLKPAKDRGGLTSDQVITRIRQKTQNMPGAILYLQNRKTYASAAGRAMPNTNTPSRRRTWTCSRTGALGCWRASRCFPNWWMSVPISRILDFHPKW